MSEEYKPGPTPYATLVAKAVDPELSVIMSNNKITFHRAKDNLTEFDLTDKEMQIVFREIWEYVKRLDKHRGYYDYNAEVYIIEIKKTLRYDVDVMQFVVSDKRAKKEYRLFDEDQAKDLVDILRDKYRE